MELNSNQIQEIIPHRYPFLLIDRVIDMEPGIFCKGIKNITANEMQFMGHFPNEHVMPGVLIVEALAQAGAIMMLSLEENKGKTAYFAGADKIKFKQKVVPGDQVVLEVNLVRAKGTIGIGQGIATVNGKVVCQGELKFAIGK